MRSAGGGLQAPLSSLPLQVAIFFHWYYAAALCVVMLLLFIYKGVMLPYSSSAIGLEVSFIFIYGFAEASRLYLATRGNKLELISPLLVSLLAAVPIIIFHVYYIRWQTYVLRLDQIVNGIALAFVAVEFVFGVIATGKFMTAQRF